MPWEELTIGNVVTGGIILIGGVQPTTTVLYEEDTIPDAAVTKCTIADATTTKCTIADNTFEECGF